MYQQQQQHKYLQPQYRQQYQQHQYQQDVAEITPEEGLALCARERRDEKNRKERERRAQIKLHKLETQQVELVQAAAAAVAAAQGPAPCGPRATSAHATPAPSTPPDRSDVESLIQQLRQEMQKPATTQQDLLRQHAWQELLNDPIFFNIIHQLQLAITPSGTFPVVPVQPLNLPALSSLLQTSAANPVQNSVFVWAFWAVGVND
jgi:hypothetical protein